MTAVGSVAAAAARSSLQRVAISLPMIAALVTLAIGLRSGSVLKDPDTYSHIAAGRWMIEHRTVPTHDPFSHSVSGAPWTAHEWGSELIMSGAFDAGGAQGLALMASIAFALTIGYLLRFLLHRMEPVHAVILLLVSGAMMSTHFLARPHVLVWPLTALWVGTLVNAGEARRPPPWWLLGVMVLWANLHLSFTLAIGLACVLALDAIPQFAKGPERIAAAQRWGVFIVAAFACAMINPHGLAVLKYTVDVMGMATSMEMIEEWRSANFHHFQPMLLWIGLVLSLGLTGRLRLSFPRLLLVAGLLYLALKHQRYHALLGVVSPLLLATPLAQGMRANPLDRGAQSGTLDRCFLALSKPAGPTGVVIAFALAVVIAIGMHRLRPQAFPAATTPERALAAFLATGVEGPVLNSYEFGGFLMFRRIPVHIDGRSDMYGDPFMRETGNAMTLATSSALEAVLSKYEIGWTLLGRETPALGLLDRLPNWQRLYADSVAVVHVRRDLLNAASSQGEQAR